MSDKAGNTRRICQCNQFLSWRHLQKHNVRKGTGKRDPGGPLVGSVEPNGAKGF